MHTIWVALDSSGARNVRFRTEKKMNARPAAAAAAPSEDNSDTDSNPDEELPEYYQPIGAVEDEEEDDLFSYILPNGYAEEAERVISSIEIHDSEDEERVTSAVVADSDLLRALSEDESRRSAPLAADQALRVMEAMRGVAFAGTAPDWVSQVPEDQWIHQLRRIRVRDSSSS